MEKNYHPEINKLPITEIDTTFSEADQKHYVGYSKQFFIVPTELVLAGEKDLWKHCPPLVNFDILTCIKEIESEGKYPYNSTVGELFASKHGIEYKEGTFLSSMVYCTQSYNHAIKAENNANELHEKLTNEGFVRATKDILQEGLKAFVVLKTTNIFGGEGIAKKEKPMKLKNCGEQGLHWMTAQAKRKGFSAYEGQYIKIV